MDSQRSFLIIALAIVSFFLWQEWQKDYGPQPAVATAQVSTNAASTADGSMASLQLESPENTVAQAAAAVSQRVKVITDTLELEIDTRGGDIVGLTLPQYALTKDSTDSYVLMRQLAGFEYVAQSGLIARDGPDRVERPLYQAANTEYRLGSEGTLTVPLTMEFNGLQIEKRFIFTEGKYDVRVEYHLLNNSTDIKTVQPFHHLRQNIDNGESGSMFMPIYRGAAFGSSEERYKKYDFSDMQKNNLNVSTQAGWVAMLEHYFVTAWIPDQQANNQLYSRITGGNKGVIGTLGPVVDIDPGQSTLISATFYAGPKIQDQLAELANGLDLTVDYGFLWFISQLLFWLLTKIQLFVSNWGLAIICITIIVKGIMFPLTKIQYESMAKMRNLKPKIEELQARYKDDRQKMGPAMMELYRKEKVNPMGGCLPMLIQMPIFLALYWVFVESVELRHAPFMLWITDLSAQDPYYVLPVLFGISMFLMQKLTPMQVTDPLQQKLMMWMPVAFSVFFLWFPSGLVLYWFVSNLISLAQMLYIYRGMEKKGLHTRKA
ncbi:membrane protein insertase YidC [Alishewanella tabrizica]|uniref:Membrane protein insertase YidC n=1 Tax=Alishewanella tabrizica TaxID=671278 RepID=A0ABQ2WSJ2_9ALTE|nr:membrane protein insertase YidC [Alishewanella tabrizica]GGW65930.1 membrane protein insertase YidC [Alishewanella tabrizica]